MNLSENSKFNVKSLNVRQCHFIFQVVSAVGTAMRFVKPDFDAVLMEHMKAYKLEDSVAFFEGVETD